MLNKFGTCSISVTRISQELFETCKWLLHLSDLAMVALQHKLVPVLRVSTPLFPLGRCNLRFAVKTNYFHITAFEMARELRLERRLTVLETVSLPLTDSRTEMVALTRLELVPNNLGDCDSVLLNYKAMKNTRAGVPPAASLYERRSFFRLCAGS